MANPYEKYVKPDNPYARYAGQVAKGFIQGGPMMAAVEAQKAGAEEAEKLAYGLGGKVTDVTGSPGLGFAANVATQAIPTLLGGEAAKLVSPAFRAAGRKLMQSALKPSKAQLASKKGQRAAQTMLDEGFNVSRGGVDKMQTMVNDLNASVDDIVRNSTASVDRNQVVNYLQDVIKKFENRPDALKAQQAVEEAWEQFVKHPMVGGQKSIPVPAAQNLKKGYQASVGEKGYGDLKTPTTESEKAIARGLREKIAQAEPGVATPLSREAALINAKKIAENRVLMDANKNPLGLGWLAQPWMIPMWMWDRSPLLKSMTARGLHSGSRVLPGAAAQAGIGALMAGQGQPPAGILSP